MVDFFVPLVALLGVALGAPTIYFKEEFDDLWTERWVKSQHLGPNQGQFKLGLGKYYADPMKDRGLQTADNSHFYGISAKFDKFSNERKTLVIQYTVKNEQFIECGGMYLKVYSSELNQTDLYSETPYLIMFGPDICGSDKKVHVIFNYKGKNLAIKKTIKCKFDELTHMYTLVVRPDNTYEVLIDHRRTESGELEADWDFLEPKKIKDPRAFKPKHWDERQFIDDPDDRKPFDWDQPEHIPDPEASRPEDWDEEMDGPWEPPMMDNPKYKGEWRARQIENPHYSGKWVHPEINNPDYVPDEDLYLYPDISHVGFDLWQVKAGTIFDNILITDDENFAREYGQSTWGKMKDPEKDMKKYHDEQEERLKKVKEERKRKEMEEKMNAPPEGSDDEYEWEGEEEEEEEDDEEYAHDEL
ncbi:calreticulin-like [Babylonia areolata]|uniref:calreticulin-like n=1 Tax=Babylonia areolata TaxID=304850 RepID=UPI003FCF8DBE